MIRARLARVSHADRAELVQANQENRAYHAPWVEPFADAAGFDAWFAATLTGPHVRLVARDADSMRIAGVVNLNEIVAGAFQSAYLGYYGMAWCAGTGLMTEAVRLAVAFAFTELGLHRVEANIQPDNLRSIALVRRLGFRKEGFSPRYLKIGGAWRDHERWARLADDA
jgi:ribosomal-protein-alanine N-acetyltransferase